MEEKKITFDDLSKANKIIKTTDIKGKDYAEVNQRVKAFRMVYPKGSIETKMIKCENGICQFNAIVYDDDNNILSTGHAEEKEGSTFINKTSYIENCETSAVGRALGFAGFGIDTSIASAEEVANAIENQKPKKNKVSQCADNYKKMLLAKLDELGINRNEYAKEHGLNPKTTQEEAKELLNKLCERGEI